MAKPTTVAVTPRNRYQKNRCFWSPLEQALAVAVRPATTIT